MSYDPATNPETIDPLLTELIRLRCEGHSFVAISAATKTPQHVVRRKLDAFAESQKEEREQLVQRCSDQLDYLWRRQLDPYCRTEKLRAEAIPDKTAATLLKIIETKAKLLGLNAPTQTQNSHSFESASDDDLRAEAQRLGIPVPAALEAAESQ